MRKHLKFQPMLDADEGGGGGSDGGDDANVSMTKAEANRLKREAAEGQKAQRKLQAEVEELKTKLEDAAVGDDELAKATKRADRAEAALEAAKAKVTELETSIEQGKRQETVKAVASRLGFKNPELASKLIGEDDTSDESSTEKALQALLKSEPYLKGKASPQRDVTGGDEGKTDEGGQKPEPKDPSPTQRMASAYANQPKE
jgi:hypothetical protein